MSLISSTLVSRSATKERSTAETLIVGTRIEAGQLVAERVSRRQHQNRRVTFGLLAELAAELDPIHAWQHEIENDDIVAIGDRQVQARHSVCGVVELVAAPLEKRIHHLGDVLVVLDEEHASRF